MYRISNAPSRLKPSGWLVVLVTSFIRRERTSCLHGGGVAAGGASRGQLKVADHRYSQHNIAYNAPDFAHDLNVRFN
jgi:hypothetical protein